MFLRAIVLISLLVVVSSLSVEKAKNLDVKEIEDFFSLEHGNSGRIKIPGRRIISDLESRLRYRAKLVRYNWLVEETAIFEQCWKVPQPPELPKLVNILNEARNIMASDLDQSLEEIIAQNEIIAKNFRTKYKKCIEAAQTTYSNDTPFHFLNEEMVKYGLYTLCQQLCVCNFETEPEYTVSTFNIDDSSNEKDTETEFSISTVVPHESDIESKAKQSVEFISKNEEGSGMDYSASTAIPVKSESDLLIDETTLALILSNLEKMGQEESDLIATDAPITDEISDSLTEDESFESHTEDFETPSELFEAEEVDHKEDTSDKLNRETAVVLEPGEDGGAENLFLIGGGFEEGISLEPFTTMDDNTMSALKSSTMKDLNKETTEYSKDEVSKSSLTAKNNREETSKILSTLDNIDIRTDSIFSSENEPEVSDDLLTTAATKGGIRRARSVNEEDIKKAQMAARDEMADIVKILLKAAEKYRPKKSETKLKLEDVKPIRKFKFPKSEIDLGIVLDNTKHTSKDSESLETSRTGFLPIPTGNGTVKYRLNMVHGVAGVDYPNFTDFPMTSFTCDWKRMHGLYADLEARCQVFHVCWPRVMETYLCPIGSTFNQEILSCDYWSESICSLAPQYYFMDDEFDSEVSQLLLSRMRFQPILYKIANIFEGGRGIKEMDRNEAVRIEFDQSTRRHFSEDLTPQEAETDVVDSVQNRFREILRSIVKSEITEDATSSDADSTPDTMKLAKRMSNSRTGRSEILPESIAGDSLNSEVAPTKSYRNIGELRRIQFKKGKRRIMDAETLFSEYERSVRVGETVALKRNLPITSGLLTFHYMKLQKKKKL